MWKLVVADKGQKKYPALGQFEETIEEMEAELRVDVVEKSVASNVPEVQRYDPQITVNHFSFEDLHFALKRNMG